MASEGDTRGDSRSCGISHLVDSDVFDFQHVLLYLAAGLNAIWIAIALLGAYRLTRFPEFESQSAPEPESWPALSVVVPACNEAGKLEDALDSLLAQDYPDLEVVLVDDRSTDGTSEIVDRLAAGDERVIPVHVTDLPPQWLGKAHALHVGTQRATGDWLLFTDADLHYEPGALERILSFAIAGEYDQMGLVPNLETKSLLLETVTQTFGTFLALSIPVHRVAEDDSDEYFGVGAFNLVRRSVFERTGGWEWLRMEIADDMGLSMMMKRHGARIWGGRAWETLSIEWYGSVGEMVAGLEKNLFAVLAQFSYVRAFAIVALSIASLAAPVVALSSPAPLGWPSSVGVAVSLIVLSISSWRAGNEHPFALLLFHVGYALLVAAFVRSTWSCWKNGGAVWRGTSYDIDELRAHQRVDLVE